MLHGLASPTGEAPKTGSFEDLQAAMKSFEGVKELDKANEQKPTAESGRKVDFHFDYLIVVMF